LGKVGSFSSRRRRSINIGIEQDAQAMAIVEKINGSKRVVPTIVFPDGGILVEPTNARPAEKLGFQAKAQRGFYDAVVMGAGPAGLTAAPYLARESLDALVIEKAGLGGQAGATQRAVGVHQAGSIGCWRGRHSGAHDPGLAQAGLTG
jgi:thioredoxin reductase (NADPH)